MYALHIYVCTVGMLWDPRCGYTQYTILAALVKVTLPNGAKSSLPEESLRKIPLIINHHYCHRIMIFLGKSVLELCRKMREKMGSIGLCWIPFLLNKSGKIQGRRGEGLVWSGCRWGNV